MSACMNSVIAAKNLRISKDKLKFNPESRIRCTNMNKGGLSIAFFNACARAK